MEALQSAEYSVAYEQLVMVRGVHTLRRTVQDGFENGVGL